MAGPEQANDGIDEGVGRSDVLFCLVLFCFVLFWEGEDGGERCGTVGLYGRVSAWEVGK